MQINVRLEISEEFQQLLERAATLSNQLEETLQKIQSCNVITGRDKLTININVSHPKEQLDINGIIDSMSEKLKEELV